MLQLLYVKSRFLLFIGLEFLYWRHQAMLGTRLFSSIQLRVIFTATIWGTEPFSGKLIVTSSAF